MEVDGSVHEAAAWVHALLLSVAPASPVAFGAVFVAAFVGAAMLGVPRTVLTLLAGSAFGFWVGFALAWTAATLAAWGSYELARLAARSRRPGGRLDRVMGRAEVAVVGAAREQSTGAARARRLAGMVSLRLLPVLPFWIVNYGSGALAAPRAAFVVGSAIGLAPGAVLYAALGGGAGAPGWVPMLLALLGVTSLATLGFARRRRSRRA